MKLTGRLKTIDTTKDKLRRMPEFKLSRIQDICGLRLDGDFTLDQQDHIAVRLQETFHKAGARDVKLRDMRTAPRNGYRAVHINANFPAGRLEVQTRSKLQSAWANVYELFGDIYGRRIRYDTQFEEPVKSLVSSLHSISDSAYKIDTAINRINRSLLDVITQFDLVPEGSKESEQINDIFLRNLGQRALTVGDQINVVDDLDAWRNKLLSERAKK